MPDRIVEATQGDSITWCDYYLYYKRSGWTDTLFSSKIADNDKNVTAFAISQLVTSVRDVR